MMEIAGLRLELTRMSRPDHQALNDRNREFVRLLAGHELRLAGYVHALVPSWHDAEDILQNTKLRLWEQFDSYRPDEDFAGWAFTVAGYLVKDYRKRCQRQRVQFSDALLEKLAQRFAVSSAWDHRTSALVECVKTLNAASRRLLRLFCTDRRKIKDIAHDLGQTPSATYQALSRTRRSLLECVRSRLGEGKE
jgi:RNA polymerase sigma-70 factor (ECF subfamily)